MVANLRRPTSRTYRIFEGEINQNIHGNVLHRMKKKAANARSDLIAGAQ
jgi:hypothetical protein